MIVVGIDPSLSGTALFCCEDFRKKDFKRIFTEKKIKKDKNDDTKNKGKKSSTEEIKERLKREYDIYKEVYTFLQFNKPDIIAIEGYSFMGINLAIQAEVVGVIGLAISRYLALQDTRKIDVIFFTPQSLKKYITGKGGGKKQIVLKEIYKKYKLDIDDDNIADAFVLSQMGSDYGYLIDYKKFRDDITSYQKDIFKNIYTTKKIVKQILKRSK